MGAYGVVFYIDIQRASTRAAGLQVVGIMEHSISVVIPVFNRDESLVRAIKSVQAQRVDICEIIIIDDCSTVDLLGTLARFEDERIRYYKLKRNRGAGYARNVGVRIARGDLIAFLDSDDVWYPDKLKQQVRELDVSGADVVYCPVDTETRSGRFVMPAAHNGNIEDALLLSGNVVVGGFSSVVVTRQAFCSVGGIRSSLRARQDYELHLRLSIAGYRYSHTDNPGMFFKTIGGNRITSNHYYRILGLLEVYRLFRERFLQCRSPQIIYNFYEVQRHLLCLRKVRYARVVYLRMIKSILELKLVNLSLFYVMLKGLAALMMPASLFTR